MDVMMISDMMHLDRLDTNNISQDDVEKLRKMLPRDLQQPGKLSQLEIIVEAIHYIKTLKLTLNC